MEASCSCVQPGQPPEEVRAADDGDNVLAMAGRIQGLLAAEKDEAVEREAVEPFPKVKVYPDVEGLAEARSKGYAALNSGRSTAWNVGGHWEGTHGAHTAEAWFSKAVWVLRTGQVSETVSDKLLSSLYFGHAKALRSRGTQWEEAEASCSEVLKLDYRAEDLGDASADSRNLQVRYWRAENRYTIARHKGVEGMAEAALQDVEQVLREAEDVLNALNSGHSDAYCVRDIDQLLDQRTGEAEKLKEDIEALCKQQAPRDEPKPATLGRDVEAEAVG